MTSSKINSLDLDCAIEPYANVKWFSPEGVVLSNGRILMIMNIQRSAAGILLPGIAL